MKDDYIIIVWYSEEKIKIQEIKAQERNWKMQMNTPLIILSDMLVEKTPNHHIRGYKNIAKNTHSRQH